MPAARYDLLIEQGATLNRGFILRNPETLVAIDLTGFGLRMQVRKTKTDTVKLDEYTTANGKLIIADALAGRVDLEVTASDTATYPSGYQGVYDMELVYPPVSGEPEQVVRLLEGAVCVSGEVTR